MRKSNLITLLLLVMASACATSPQEVKPIIEDTPVEVIPEHTEVVKPIQPSVPAVPDIVEEEEFSVQDKPKKYPPLIYGLPKPLVCSHPYWAEKKLQNRPNLQVMWENYLYERPERVWAEVGGTVEYNGCLPEDQGGWRNACTVRLSHMLNKAGHKIPAIKGQTVSGESGDQYFFRLDDALAYIRKRFGAPDITIDMPGQLFDLPQHPGLFIIKYPGSNFTGHVTILNGAGTVDGVDIVGYEIYFWNLPCFIPSEREQTQQ